MLTISVSEMKIVLFQNVSLFLQGNCINCQCISKYSFFYHRKVFKNWRKLTGRALTDLKKSGTTESEDIFVS